MATNFQAGLHLNYVYRSQRLATRLRNQSAQLTQQAVQASDAVVG
jgi:hypothetical protein